MPNIIAEAKVDEARRLATVWRALRLMPGERGTFDVLCRLACRLLDADAAALSFLTDTEQIFLGRCHVEVERIPRVTPSAAVQAPLIDIADLAEMPPTPGNPPVDGSMDSFRSTVAVPVRFEGQQVGVLTCYFHTQRHTARPDDIAGLTDLRDLAERLIMQEAALTSVARTATLAVEGTART